MLLLRRCLAIEIDCSAAQEEIEARWQMSNAVLNAGHRFFSGELTGEDFLDLIQPALDRKIDQYIEEIESNIEEAEAKTGLILI